MYPERSRRACPELVKGIRGARPARLPSLTCLPHIYSRRELWRKQARARQAGHLDLFKVVMPTPSLEGAGFLAYASEQAPQFRRFFASLRMTKREVARNDGWCVVAGNELPSLRLGTGSANSTPTCLCEAR
jgi:hypothetical protein